MKHVSIFQNNICIKQFVCQYFAITKTVNGQTLEFLGVPSKMNHGEVLTVVHHGEFNYSIDDLQAIAVMELKECNVEIYITW